jgi:hypothetical protein
MMETRLQSAEQQSNDKCTKYNHASTSVFSVFVYIRKICEIRWIRVRKNKKGPMHPAPAPDTKCFRNGCNITTFLTIFA